MKDVFIVIDMQKDFVTGVLGSTEAAAIVPTLEQEIRNAAKEDYTIIFTRDTHQENYMETQEGRLLPVPHCIEGSDGWQIVDELSPYSCNRLVVDKPSFGSPELSQILADMNSVEGLRRIVLTGVCTDICVISNAMLIKATKMLSRPWPPAR